jgi:hypothetical protein
VGSLAITKFTHLQLKDHMRVRKPVSRRPLLVVTFIIVALASGGMPLTQGVRAESKPNEIRGASWLVGGNLSLAAMSYFRSTGSYESILDRAKTYASYIDVDIKPLPPKPPNPTDGILSLLDYFNKGDGARIGTYLEAKHGQEASTLYLTAVRSMQLPLFYDLDPPLGDKFAAVILGNMTKLKVPENLWKPVVDAVAKRAGFKDVRAAVIKMDDDVTQYLVKN